MCSDERGWTENPLVYCDGQGCTVAVHQGIRLRSTLATYVDFPSVSQRITSVIISQHAMASSLYQPDRGIAGNVNRKNAALEWYGELFPCAWEYFSQYCYLS